MKDVQGFTIRSTEEGESRMLLGVRITPSSVIGTRVGDNGRVRELRLPREADRLSEPLERLLSRLSGGDPEPASAIVFDVSAALVFDIQRPVTVVRIVPRPPLDADHDIAIDTDSFNVDAVVHINGGHTALGRELVSLDTEALTSLAESNRQDSRYVVTSVGALIHPAHELEAERLLTENPHTASVEGSRNFHSSSFAVRERTALTNHALLPCAEALGTTLAHAAEQAFPEARLYVTVNDGGRAPLSRLMVSPVHSMLSGRPTALVGAAALSGIREDGRLIVTRGQESFIGEMLAGVPTVIPYVKESVTGRLATQTANTRLIDPSAAHDRARPSSTTWRPPTAVTERDQPEQSLLGSGPAFFTSLDLGALGAACSTLSDWATQFIHVANAEELAQRMATAEARVVARLVTAGAAPPQTRIVESHVATTAYEPPDVVAVHVRGVAGSSPMLDLTGDD